MLWQDRNGNWFSTKSPIDMKIEKAMIEANANKVWEEGERSGEWLFAEMFGGDWLLLRALQMPPGVLYFNV